MRGGGCKGKVSGGMGGDVLRAKVRILGEVNRVQDRRWVGVGGSRRVNEN